VIAIKNLSFAYRNGTKVLKNVDLDIKNGYFFGILGPNGSGKTTLLRCITRTVDVPPGKVWIDGKDVKVLKRREIARRVGVVPQEVSYEFDFTVQEVVSMGRYPHLGRFEFESPKHRAVVKKAMEFTEVLGLKDKAITRISGGEKQRVMIAQAFAQEPDILLLDEPTKNLDIGHTLDILDLIKRSNRKVGVTVVAVLHDLNLAARYCDRVALFDKGKVFAVGSVPKVLSPRNISKVFGVEAVIDKEGVDSFLRILGRSAASIK
jgi:iron complex transport system ATP-binding protein